MIQIKHLMIGDDEKDANELAKVINWLDKENVEYDLIPPEYFDGYETIGNATYVKTKKL